MRVVREYRTPRYCGHLHPVHYPSSHKRHSLPNWYCRGCLVASVRLDVPSLYDHFKRIHSLLLLPCSSGCKAHGLTHSCSCLFSSGIRGYTKTIVFFLPIFLAPYWAYMARTGAINVTDFEERNPTCQPGHPFCPGLYEKTQLDSQHWSAYFSACMCALIFGSLQARPGRHRPSLLYFFHVCTLCLPSLQISLGLVVVFQVPPP
jgi:hypothetical protein